MSLPLPARTAALLTHNRDKLAATPALLGFDGFVDTIYHAVDTRQSATEYTRVPTLEAFGNRIAAAAGKSTNVEIVPQQVKLGGNGPIMAFAMTTLGFPMTYCGMTGRPATHEVFSEFASCATLLPLSEPALTDAYEFDDGKLIVGKHATVAEVSFPNILERIGEARWHEAWQQAKFVGMVNWTMLPYLTHVWQQLLSGVAANSEGGRKTLFFDLADPEKRTVEDLTAALHTIARFEPWHDVVLGLNEKEAVQVAEVLGVQVTISEGLREGHTNRQLMLELASGIRARLGIAVCVVHPTHFAVAADAQGAVAVDGPFTPKPKISTGAGDHFNAGFCCGRIMGSSLEEALQCGVGTSGYYVRHAASPTVDQLADFLSSL